MRFSAPRNVMPEPSAEMSQESWVQIVYLGITAVIASAGTVLASWFRNRPNPVEIAKLAAETRSIDIASDLSVIAELREVLHEAVQATGHAERIKGQRDHWERKATTLKQQVDLLEIEIHSMDNQMRKLSGYVKAKGLNPSELDKPKD